MQAKTKIAGSVDEYIAGFPPVVQQMMQEIRNTIHRAAPGVEETIKYAMPTFMLNGNLVYFAAYKSHIGFYPLPKGDKALNKALESYKTGKGSVQLPLERPMPIEIIERIVRIRVKENGLRAKRKK